MKDVVRCDKLEEAATAGCDLKISEWGNPAPKEAHCFFGQQVLPVSDTNS